MPVEDVPPFQYDVLDGEMRVFRLLRLEPWNELDPDMPLACNMVTREITKAPPYRAVSYMWGTAGAEKLIQLNGQPFRIRYNLYALLLQLSRHEYAGWLWIDAICIDQQAIQDRNHQVRLMGQIYESARKVTVWLGEAEPDTDRLMRFLKGESKEQILDSDLWHKLEIFFAHPYWSRAWIVQEVLLARDVRLIWGTQVLFWEHIQDWLNFYESRIEKHRSLYVTRGMAVLLQKRQRMLSKPVGPGQADHRIPLLDLLEQNKTLACMDKRDRVYALMSLATDCGPGSHLQADYAVSIMSLFFDVLAFEVPARIFDTARWLSEVFELGLGIRSSDRVYLTEARSVASTKLGLKVKLRSVDCDWIQQQSFPQLIFERFLQNVNHIPLREEQIQKFADELDDDDWQARFNIDRSTTEILQQRRSTDRDKPKMRISVQALDLFEAFVDGTQRPEASYGERARRWAYAITTMMAIREFPTQRWTLKHFDDLSGAPGLMLKARVYIFELGRNLSVETDQVAVSSPTVGDHRYLITTAFTAHRMLSYSHEPSGLAFLWQHHRQEFLGRGVLLRLSKPLLSHGDRVYSSISADYPYQSVAPEEYVPTVDGDAEFLALKEATAFVVSYLDGAPDQIPPDPSLPPTAADIALMILLMEARRKWEALVAEYAGPGTGPVSSVAVDCDARSRKRQWAGDSPGNQGVSKRLAIEDPCDERTSPICPPDCQE